MSKTALNCPPKKTDKSQQPQKNVNPIHPTAQVRNLSRPLFSFSHPLYLSGYARLYCNIANNPPTHRGLMYQKLIVHPDHWVRVGVLLHFVTLALSPRLIEQPLSGTLLVTTAEDKELWKYHPSDLMHITSARADNLAPPPNHRRPGSTTLLCPQKTKSRKITKRH